MNLTIEWKDGDIVVERLPLNPDRPDGSDVDVTEGAQGCSIEVPYPASGVGLWFVSCPECRSHLLFTANGRADDPRSCKIPCLNLGAKNENRSVDAVADHSGDGAGTAV